LDRFSFFPPSNVKRLFFYAAQNRTLATVSHLVGRHVTDSIIKPIVVLVLQDALDPIPGVGGADIFYVFEKRGALRMDGLLDPGAIGTRARSATPRNRLITRIHDSEERIRGVLGGIMHRLLMYWKSILDSLSMENTLFR
jgi:hypothetical protein